MVLFILVARRDRFGVSGQQIEPFDVREDGPVGRRARGCEDADDRELAVCVSLGAVSGGDPLADLQFQLARGFRADDRLEEAVFGAVVLEVSAPGEFISSFGRGVEDEAVEHLGRGAHDAVAFEVIAHTDRNRHGDLRGEPAVPPVEPLVPFLGRQELLVVRVGDGFDRLAQVVDRVEHQLQPPALGADDDVVTQVRVAAERVAHHAGDQQHGHDHHHAQRHRRGRQRRRQRATLDASPGYFPEIHGSLMPFLRFLFPPDSSHRAARRGRIARRSRPRA